MHKMRTEGYSFTAICMHYLSNDEKFNTFNRPTFGLMLGPKNLMVHQGMLYYPLVEAWWANG